jgi:hypothetical protein
MDKHDSVVTKLERLRDEIKLHLHLASLDAKKEWDETLEPRVLEIEQAARDAAEDPQGTVRELVERVEGFARRLRDKAPTSQA